MNGQVHQWRPVQQYPSCLTLSKSSLTEIIDLPGPGFSQVFQEPPDGGSMVGSRIQSLPALTQSFGSGR